MPMSEVTIAACFSPMPTYTISATGSGNGTIHINTTTAKEGETISLEATPHDGYAFDRWVVTSKNVAVSNIKQPRVSFKMPADDVAITASFVPASAQYTITVDAIGNGSVYTNHTTAKPGELVILYAAPRSGHRFNRWMVMNGEVPLINPSSTYTSFRMPRENVKIMASFMSARSTVQSYFAP